MAGICRTSSLEYKNLTKVFIMRKTLSNLLPQNCVYDEMDSPVGILTIAASEKGLCAILWDHDLSNEPSLQFIHNFKKSVTNKTIINTKQQLGEYFIGARKVFDLPLVINGTPFQNLAWHELLKIPYAKTISYGEQAKKLGDKNKARAVGMANGLNPISIVIPCHRVIGSNGSLTGFGGGLDRKEFLLQLERKNTYLAN
jgi:methylated-DNA-[protein]-cysteine S-methyltransferase